MTWRIAVDIGAESGRVMLGRDGHDDLMEVHRFANGGVEREGGLRWDLPRLFTGIRDGLKRAAARQPLAVSIGIDTWGVDYGLVDAHGALVEPAWHHRDRRTEGAVAEIDRLMPAAERFRRTGVQPLPFNTLYQLAVHLRRDPAVFQRAARLLTVPDVLLGWLCGTAVCEHTNAGTTELLRAGTREWDTGLADAIGLPRRLLAPVVAPGTVLGLLRPELADECGFAEAPTVVAPACHDTASAAACVADADPLGGGCYLSSGTWSLLGTTLDAPALGDAVRAAGFSNEVAADGRPRLNRNIMGLWIVQECRRAFAAAGRDRDYATLTALAEAAAPPVQPLDVDDPRFLPALGEPMPARVAAWYRERGLPAPDDDGAVIRAVLEGLAAAYARAVTGLEGLIGHPIRRITVVGGGVRNALLLRLTETACARPVVAGPAEATALGNLRLQGRACRR